MKRLSCFHQFHTNLWLKSFKMSSNRNRFWAGSDSSEESTDEYSYSESSEEEVVKKMPQRSKYTVISDSEEEEEKRVVKSPKYSFSLLI